MVKVRFRERVRAKDGIGKNQEFWIEACVKKLGLKKREQIIFEVH